MERLLSFLRLSNCLSVDIRQMGFLFSRHEPEVIGNIVSSCSHVVGASIFELATIRVCTLYDTCSFRSFGDLDLTLMLISSLSIFFSPIRA